MNLFFTAPLLLLVGGSALYCILVIVAAAAWRRSGTPLLNDLPPVTVLRPLAGDRDNTEANLRSVFMQRYPRFEVLLAVHQESDPAADVARRVMAQYPQVPARLIVTGRSPFPNAKVWSLRALVPEAGHENLVMTDSDILLAPGSLAAIVSELSAPGVAMVTCPYRATSGPGLWRRAEALGLNTEFIAGVLAARLLTGMDFAIGCTIAMRRGDLDAIGGFARLQPYLAEDFVLGNLLHARGRVVLSRCVIGHFIGEGEFAESWRHRVRWARSTRRSRRAGYFGEVFTKTMPFAIALWIAAPSLWPVAASGLVLRLIAVLCANACLRTRAPQMRNWPLLPLEELLGFATWLAGFFGRTISWRGRTLVLMPDGSLDFVPVTVVDTEVPFNSQVR